MISIPIPVHRAVNSVSRPRRFGWAISAAYTAAGELDSPMARPKINEQTNLRLALETASESKPSPEIIATVALEKFNPFYKHLPIITRATIS